MGAEAWESGAAAAGIARFVEEQRARRPGR